MKLYKHKAICEYCNEQEFDGTWIRKNGNEANIGHKNMEQRQNRQFHYICFRCIEKWFIQNDC